MQWITAILAFAVTMLVFAMVTSTLVESIHRVLSLRTAGLKLMLANVFDYAVRPHLAGVVAASAAPPMAKQTATDAGPPIQSPEEARQAFVEHMTLNRATRHSPTTPRGRWIDRLTGLINWFTDRFFGVTSVPVEVFTQKLADPRFQWNDKQPTPEVITDIALKYESFGREASVYFESRARLLSVVVAIPVAWAFFVHPYKLAIVYTNNPEVASAVANQATEITKQVDALRQRVAKDTGNNDTKTAVASVTAALEDAAKRAKELSTVGVPLGWPSIADRVADCKTSSKVSEDSIVTVCWWLKNDWNIPTVFDAIWLTVGGLLIGLGAPFWARTVSALASARTGSWQRVAEIVGARQEGKPDPGASQAVNAPAIPVPNRTFDVAFAAGRGDARSE